MNMENELRRRKTWKSVGRSLRRSNDQARIENPLARYSDEELEADVEDFVENYSRFLRPEAVLRAAHVARDVRIYDELVHTQDQALRASLRVKLEDYEIRALKREKESAFSERGMRVVILTVSLAALLQGFVQSSFNSANLYQRYWREMSDENDRPNEYGLTNAIAYWSAAILGCPLADPINRAIGRKGTIFLAAVLIFASSLGSAFVDFVPADDPSQFGKSEAWKQLCGLRLVNGIGMGLKAVTTPVLASESAIGYWRGSSILAWQLWVAFGIMLSFAVNLLFSLAPDPVMAARLILASPMVPALILAVTIPFCPESPRYYLRRGREDYLKAYESLKRLQAVRDLYMVHKNLQLEDYAQVSAVDGGEPRAGDPEAPRQHVGADGSAPNDRAGPATGVKGYFARYVQIFRERRLRNAMIAAGTVALGQQLSGINISAFYSNDLLSNSRDQAWDAPEDELKPAWRDAMLYSWGFGMINFLFALPAIRTIDSLGRRKWLLLTLPFMAVFLMGAALSTDKHYQLAIFLYLHAAFYSPGMGPIPFTLASEAFPLSHRETGASLAIFVNLFFAGLLAWFFQNISDSLGDGGSIGLFAGFNILAFVLVFLFVEETKRRSLEELDQIFAVRKGKFVRHQVATYLPWWLRRWILWRDDEPKPDFYDDRTARDSDHLDVDDGGVFGGTWGPSRAKGHVSRSSGPEMTEQGGEPGGRRSEDSNVSIPSRYR
ncbi:hypothetical protein MKZ38_004675 [Zalerion maritima]|uniref:Major facilitator superfamily (MFS) profile domain-containing protein n=1 Tax=Zalerion maritima TaxID=339359 RepID=A0AAD5RRX4_9PEZI|nr:hypothetical protein MKZ38_004675 [Zalerion maritima]